MIRLIFSRSWQQGIIIALLALLTDLDRGLAQYLAARRKRVNKLCTSGDRQIVDLRKTNFTLALSEQMKQSRQKTTLIVLLFFLYSSFLIGNGYLLWNLGASDFPSFYYAPRLVFEKGLPPYSPDNWRVVYTLLDIPIWPFLYPPPTLLAFRVLNLFSYESAKNLFLVVNHLLTHAFAGLFVYKILRIRAISALGVLSISYIFLFRPLSETLRYGQVNLVVLFLILLAWYWLKTNRSPVLAALPLSLSILLKVYPAFLLVYLLLKGKYHHFLYSLVFLALLSVITLPFLPPGIWADWQANVAGQGYGSWVRGLDPAMLANQSINGFTMRFFVGRGDIVQPVFPSLLAARMVPLFLSGVVGLMAPIVWEHQLVLLLPPVFLALHAALTAEPAQPWRIICVVSSAGPLFSSRANIEFHPAAYWGHSVRVWSIAHVCWVVMQGNL